METTTNHCEEIAGLLGLKWGGEDLFIGRIRGFPVGLKFVGNESAVLLLFQVRHWLTESAAQAKSVTYDEATTALLAERKIEIDFDERVAWVTLLEFAARPEEALRVLDGVLQAFEKAGFIGDPELCHYCQKEKTTNLEVADGKVAQICPTCLEERLNKHRAVTAGSTTAEAVPIALMSPVAAAVGAILWAAFWALWTWFLEGPELRMPVGLIGIIMIGVGFLVGGPVGWIIKQNRRRGAAVSAAAAILFGVLAVVAGEILFVAWLIYHHLHFFSLSTALHVMPRLYLHDDPFYLAFKGLAAFTSVGIAYEISKPKKASLKL